MSKDDFTKQESIIVVSTLLKCAAFFGYRPKPSDFSGRTINTIRRLNEFLMEKLNIEAEAKQLFYDRRQNEN